MKVTVKDLVVGRILFERSREGNLDQVRDLLQRGANANFKDPKNGSTALCAASYNGITQVVLALLNHGGVDANCQNNNGRTALILASWKGHIEVVRALLKHKKVKINLQDYDGWTALMLASLSGHSEVVRALLNRDGVDVNIKDNDGKTALDFARSHAKDDVLLLLEEHIRTELKKRNAEEEQRQLEEDERNRRKDAEPNQDMEMERKRRRQEWHNSASTGSGPVQQVTGYLEQDRNKLLEVMNATSAEPVELSLEYIERCIKKDHTLGSGAFGDVFLAEDSSFPKKFAVKMIRPTHCDEDIIEDFRKTFQTELSTLKRFRHPNIIALYGYSLNANIIQQCLVYEHAANGSLADFLSNDGDRARLPAVIRLPIMFQIVRAVHFLHTGGCKVAGVGWKVFHRDITSANICLADDYTPRLIDCGLATFVPDDNFRAYPRLQSTTGGPALGTPGYMCPEYLRKKGRGIPCPYIAAFDVYSIGVVLVELILGCLYGVQSTRNDSRFLDLFEKYVQEERTNHRVVDGWEMLKRDADPTITWNPDALEIACKAAIQCMAPFPEERLNTKDLLDILRDAILLNSNADIQHPKAENAVDSDQCCVICNNYSADIQCSEGHSLCTTCIVDTLGDHSGCQLLCLIKGCSSPPFQDRDIYGRIPYESFKRYIDKRTVRRIGTNVSSDLNRNSPVANLNSLV